MSVYFQKGKGWRYDFTLNGTRYTQAWFKTKREAMAAEGQRKEEINNPKTIEAIETQTDMAFLELVNRRLDHVKAYNSESHYRDVGYHCRRWVKEWQEMMCGDITTGIIEDYLKKRLMVSSHVANKELQYLRALFNYGTKKKLIESNPTDTIDFFPVEKRKKYVPPKEDVLKVIAVADPEAQQYLWTILLTAGRVSEINSLTWDDVNFHRRLVTLWTRKRKGGHREPREVPMIGKLYEILNLRDQARDDDMPWVFWHLYRSRKTGNWVKGPYKERKRLMSTLCRDAKVRYFRYHALRHLTASILDHIGIPIGTIQRILGHQNRRTTEIYLHSIGEAERQAMAKLETASLFQADEARTQLSAPVNVHTGYWNRKVLRPSYHTLKSDIERLGYSGTGRKYGVSDNAIRKWQRFYEAGAFSKLGEASLWGL
ncbi:MAG TPA: site-specific integrase, partial [Desulfobacteraceae bacterium]|nr:site-specific integrase [Desulfobacteraceae bacterium]